MTTHLLKIYSFEIDERICNCMLDNVFNVFISCLRTFIQINNSDARWNRNSNVGLLSRGSKNSLSVYYIYSVGFKRVVVGVMTPQKSSLDTLHLFFESTCTVYIFLENLIFANCTKNVENIFLYLIDSKTITFSYKNYDYVH